MNQLWLCPFQAFWLYNYDNTLTNCHSIRGLINYSFQDGGRGERESMRKRNAGRKNRQVQIARLNFSQQHWNESHKLSNLAPSLCLALTPSGHQRTAAPRLCRMPHFSTEWEKHEKTLMTNNSITMWAHQPFVNQPKQGFNLMLWPRLELICRWRRDGAMWLALWELEGWRVLVCRGRRRRGGMEGRFCHVPAHTQQPTSRERNASSVHNTHTHSCM